MRSISQTNSVIDCCNRKLYRAHKLLESQFTSGDVWVTSGCCFALGITRYPGARNEFVEAQLEEQNRHTHRHPGGAGV